MPINHGQNATRGATDAAHTAARGPRFAIAGGVVALLAGALYLMAVRGEAVLLDLSAFAGRVWCF
jgi:hypothetical protein